MTYGIFGGRHLNVSDTFGFLFRHVFTEHGTGALLDGLRDEAVAVYLGTFHGNEQMTILDLARVYVHAGDVGIHASNDRGGLDALEKLL